VIAAAREQDYLLVIPIQLEYTSPAGCPTQAEFVAAVASRGGDFAHPGPEATARAMVVTLRRSKAEHTGSLQLRFDDTVSDARLVHAEGCAEVADALAVVAAIALRGTDDAAVPAQPSPRLAPAAPPAQAMPQPSEPTRPVQAPKDTRLHPAGLWGSEPVSVTAGELRVNRSLVATLSGGVVLGAIPGMVLPRYDLSFTRTNFITTPEHTSYLIGTVFGVRWSYLGNATRRSDGYSTEVSGFKAGLTACSSLTYDTNGFVFLFCTGFTAGLMHQETREVAGPHRQSKDIGLGAASLELDGRYNLGEHLHVSLNVGGEMWLGKLTAEGANGSELFHSRLFNANAQLGVGVHF